MGKNKTKNIRQAVENELTFDPLVDATDITVINMNGEVTLNGTVPSYPQYLQAVAAAQRVAGVTNVHNHLQVVLPPGDERDNARLTTACQLKTGIVSTGSARLKCTALQASSPRVAAKTTPTSKVSGTA